MGDLSWVEESNGHAFSSRKRKARPKRFQFVGWGSRQLIEFLKFRGKDTTTVISRFEASETIARHISEKGLLDSSNKKKVVCDDWLMSLFGTKTISRIKVYDLLEKHYKENQDDSDFDYLYEDEPQIVCHSEKIAKLTRKVVQKPRGIFAAIVSDNIKLLYLRKSLVQELLKSPDTFESKMVASFVRIKSDPNDYLQKNPYQLVQVTGVKKEHGTDDFLLQVTNYMKDVSISMLSDDNFTQEECEDLHQRIENGSLKKLTIVEMEEKARSLHEDQTKHWLEREIVLLQRLIDRANEKGWRRELSEYLEKRELLQNPEEQSRLLRKVPEVIGEELIKKHEAAPEAHDNEQQLSESPISSIQETPEFRNLSVGDDQQCNGFLISNPSTTPGITSYGMEVNRSLPIWTAYTGDEDLHGNAEQRGNSIIAGETPLKETTVTQLQSSIPVIEIKNRSQSQPNPSQIIDLSDDDDENGETLNPRVEDAQILSHDKEKLNWLYKDPRGDPQVEEVQILSHDKEKLNWLYKDPRGDPQVEEVQILSHDKEKLNWLYKDPRGNPQVEEVQILSRDKEKLNWLYKDPQGDIQGPFSLTQLKQWNDAEYFAKDFKVWMIGQSLESAVLLTDVLRRVY